MAKLNYKISTRDNRSLLTLVRAVFFLVLIGGLFSFAMYLGYLKYTELKLPKVELQEFAFDVDPSGRRVNYHRSWIERKHGLWHLHLVGTPEEMGAAHGQLAQQLFPSLVPTTWTLMDRFIHDRLATWVGRVTLRWDFRNADHGFHEDFKRELAALAQSVAMPPDFKLNPYHHFVLQQCFLKIQQEMVDLSLHGTVFANNFPGSSTSASGNLIVAHALSLPPATMEMTSLDGQEGPERMVSFYYPDGKYPFVSIGWAGLLGVVTGVNSRGLVVAINPAQTDEPIAEGTPLPLVLREILANADTLEQALLILKQAKIQSAGSVFLGDGTHRRSLIVELSPQKNAEERFARGERDRYVWATDHLIRDVFEQDGRNHRVQQYTASGHRYERLQQLLRSTSTLTPTRALEILRDRKAIGDGELGLGHPQALENLQTTQAVIIDATAMVLWVAEGPSALGRFRAIDLRYHLMRIGDRPAPLEDLPADRLLYSEELADYRTAQKAILAAEHLTNQGHFAAAEHAAQIALALAPGMGEIHRLLGDLERNKGQYAQALVHYRRYLELTPANLREQERIRGLIDELSQWAETSS